MLTCNHQNHIQHSASSSKTEGNGKASPVSDRNCPREYSRIACCVKCWILTIKLFIWIRKSRYLNLRNCPLPSRMSWWLSQDASPIYGKLLKGFDCHVRRSGHLSGLVEKPFPLQGYSTHKIILQCWNPALTSLFPVLPAKPLLVAVQSLWGVICWAMGVLSLMWSPGLSPGPGWTTSSCAPSLPLQTGSNPACHSWWVQKGGIFLHALAYCAAPQNRILKLLLCLLLMEEINRPNK